MATLTTVRLTKGNSPNWGFRLQGGKDFGTPLVIQKVNGGSPAERAGLIAGDSVIRINNVDVYNLLHKEAQDVIVRSGTDFEMVIQRGGSTWKPSVVPTGTYSKPSPSINNVSPVTKTSLTAAKGENIGAIGTGHNLSAKPFSPQVNGAVNGGPPQLVNKQYNSPLKLYSEDAIAETISAQSEVLSTGALGVNFKKNEKGYDASNSAVYRMLQEAENDNDVSNQPVSRHPESYFHSNPAPEGDRVPSLPLSSNQSQPPNVESATICTDCERVIVGVFVRIKDKNLHVECFKCATCGSSLKNVGYYNINNKLYCDIHAKSAAIAINNPAAIPIPAGGRAPASAISSALSGHSLPTSSPLSPKTPSYAPSYPSNNFGGPKPFSSVSAPLSPGGTLPRAAPLSPPNRNFNKAPLSPPQGHSYGGYSPASTARTTNIVWPPQHEDPDVPTACPLFYPPPSRVEAEIEKKAAKKRTEFESDYFADEDETMSFYSEEISFSGRRSATECVELLTETLDTQKLVDSVIKSAPPLNNNDLSTVDLELVSGGKTIITSAQKVEAGELKRLSEYTPNTVECKLQSRVENSVPQKWESPLVQAVRTTAPDSDTFSLIPSRKAAASPMASALATAPAQPYNLSTPTNVKPVPLPDETEPYFPPEHPLILKEHTEESTTKEEKLPIPKPYSPFVRALEIAPERPFTPIGGPAPLPPVKKKPKDPLDKLLEDLPRPEEKLDMRSALTTAPERPYTPLIAEHMDAGNTKAKEQKPQDLSKPLKPEELPPSFKMNFKAPKPPSYYPPSVLEERIQAETQESVDSSESKETKITETEVIQPAHITHQVISLPQEIPQQPSAFAPLFQGFSCSFKNKTDHSQFSIEVSTTPPVLSPPPKPQTPISYIATVEERPACVTREKVVEEKAAMQQHSSKQEKMTVQVTEKQREEVVQVKPVPVTAMLHKPEGLPSYQMDLKATAEADLILMERRQRAEERLEEQKRERERQQQQQQLQQQQQQQIQQQQQQQFQQQQQQQRQQPRQNPAPIITFAPSESNNVDHQINFKPVLDDKPQSGSFSPRPRPLTPSMINKAPPLLPYYQDNLLPHYQGTVETNLFDPAHPELSRTPSPHPDNQGRSRSPSPFPGLNRQHERAKSPAEGPPPNPLQSNKPLPNPQDSRVKLAKESLQSYLPDYKSQRDRIEEQQGMDFCSKREIAYEEAGNLCRVSQNVAYPAGAERQTGNVQHQVQQLLQVCDRDQHSCQVKQSANTVAKTDISEKHHQENFSQKNQTHSNSTTVSADGLTQVQRKKIVTEEFEHQHKEANLQIERSVTTTTSRPFSKVNVPAVEPSSLQTFHVTNPHHRMDTPTTLQQASDRLSETCRGQLQQAPTPPPMPPIRKVFPPGSLAPIKHVPTPAACPRPSANVTKPSVPKPNVGAGTGRQTGGITAAPKRGRGLLNTAALPGSRVPLCGHCHGQIRGPFITALGKIWCPQHFVCTTPSCRRPLQDIGFVEEQGQLYCEYCFEQYLAPPCSKCNSKIKTDCLKAIGKNFHPECFNCVYCGKLFGNSPFFLEDGNPYCEADWNELFTTKCFACGFPVEAGDRWVEALNNNYHSQCFNCTMCKKNLEGQSFFAKGGRPFCKNHAR